jgi:serine/threonine protein kinase
MFTDKYLLANKIGSGKIGTIYVVQDLKTKQNKACKIINKNHANIDRTKHISEEIQICNEMSYIPEVSKIIDICYDNENAYLVQELYTGGTFFENQNWFNQNQDSIKKYMYKLMLFLHECHEKNIVYADIKPSNLMFDNDENKNMRIIDFGASSYLDNNTKFKISIRGSLLYMAPEVLNRFLSVKADSWSCGILLYYLYTQKYPFWVNDINSLYTEKIVDGIITNDIIYNKDIPDNAMDLITKLLNKNVINRISISDALNHDYYRV